MGALEGKVAIITGAGRGIGAACARLFAGEGARVLVASRTRDQIEEAAGEIEAEFGPGRALAWPCDVSDENAIRDLFSQCGKRLGAPDILVNNAAIVELAEVVDMESSLWDRMMQVNLRGSFLCAREAFRAMKGARKGGAIVNVGSLGGIQGTEKFKGLSAYTVSKFGVVGLTECLAVEGRELGIRVNCVAPGAVDTEMLRKAAPFLKTKTRPEDVARTILFFCDEARSHAITGAVLPIYSNL